MTRQYIGARYVPMFYEGSNGSEWEPGVAYDPLTIVTVNGSSYTSKKYVPASTGSPQNNPTYWVASGVFNQQLADIMNRLTPLEKSMSALMDPDAIVVSDPENEAFHTGVEYYFAVKEYDITSPILISASNIKLHGCGAVINNPNNAPAIKVTGNNVEIDGFIINNTSTVYEPEDTGSDNIYGAIHVYGYDAKIHDNIINRVLKAGIYLRGSGDVYHNNIFSELVPGVYDSVSTNNQQYGIYTRNESQTGRFRVYENVVRQSIIGIYHGGFNYMAGHRIEVYERRNLLIDCVDHGLYINGGYDDDIRDNILVHTGGIAVQSINTQRIIDNVLMEGFSDASISAVENPSYIDIREPSDCSVKGNTIIQTNLASHAGREIYLHHNAGSAVIGADNIWKNISIENNDVRCVSGTLFALGSDDSTKMTGLQFVGNKMEISNPRYEPMMLYGKTFNCIFANNLFKFTTPRNYGIQMGESSGCQWIGNVFEDTYANNATGRTWTQTGAIKNCQFIGNRTKGCMISPTINDSFDAIGNNVDYLPLCNAIANEADLNVAWRGNRFSGGESKRGTLTTNGSGVASKQGAFLPGMVVRVYPDAYTDGFTAFYTIGTNGWLNISTNAPNATIHYEVI